MNKDDKIYIAGHRGLAGSSIVRKLKENGFNNLVLRTSSEINLCNYNDTLELFESEKPDYVFMCAGTVGGIMANKKYPVEFTQNNILMAINVLALSHKYNVKKLLYLGSSCIYPKECKQPIEEEYLMSGRLEDTNEGYALAKVTGVYLTSYYRREYGVNFISCIPSNLYGINDNYDDNNSHVVSSLIKRFHEAKIKNINEVTVWGDGTPLREFTYTDDFADACIFLMNNYDGERNVHVGANYEYSIYELAKIIAKVIDYKGNIKFDTSYPNGMKRKVLNSDFILSMGWKPKTSFEDGLKLTYKNYIDNLNKNNLRKNIIRNDLL
ncbi:GDP-L-fucose synthase family protein [Brachyspira hampsonii]|uniref:GDP-L-fucose synthase n=1 Tax=Brachyspira hampsonii 30446 TaxID=1289135 RepID=A0A2U4F3I0_9SPIR|nr:GDP-L-fucose synthase [Brachyspira hampsonii]EKV58029.1 nad-dependent epimerase/dehydratase [Brachyspira hampsonii 30446]MBW5390712.1 GDP-L-fucose synthase [Brachyspira hampsonii]MBW5393595.1 GDP-L-fucose synthase [Brachyspira hampsonii]OEJ16723.1 GDP-fucose synthetase [Brachyspira hampsonii]